MSEKGSEEISDRGRGDEGKRIVGDGKRSLKQFSMVTQCSIERYSMI